MLDARLDEIFRSYRPNPTYPVYPPYHEGYYLEDYFYYNYAKSETNRLYIPVFWTTCYIENKKNELQKHLNRLNKEARYFTISQHDDAIKEELPKDTIKFSAGGNVICENTVPIPLVCSKIKSDLIHNHPRDILASFVGSITHPIRSTLCEYYKGDKDILLSSRSWTPSVGVDNFNNFVYITSRSQFALCPRGYGLNSFRLYEAFQLGAIPVIITDRFYLPWEDEINWADIAVLVEVADIPNIKNILLDKSSEEIEAMQSSGKRLYEEYFTLDGVCNNILKRLR
jgi:hypothetical protein